MKCAGFTQWFTETFTSSGARFKSFHDALQLFVEREGKTIVETGTTRMVDDWGAGMSTVIFADVCKHYGGHIWTVDIEPKNMDCCREITHLFKPQIDYVVSDSLTFLRSWTIPIDLLYLDSMDCPLVDNPDDPELIKSQGHQLQELTIAFPMLHDKSIVLLDDVSFANGGKGKLSRKFLAELGWTELIFSQQSLWVKA
jgi:hypothetical protein